MDDISKLNNLIKDLEMKLKQKLINRSFFKSVSKDIREEIQDRVQRGYGVEEHGKSKQKLKRLATSTKIRRKHLKIKGKLSSKTSPTKSNQIETGKMLESLKESANRYGFDIEVRGNRKKVYEYQEEGGRPWLYLTKEEEKTLDKAVEKGLDDAFDDIFND